MSDVVGRVYLRTPGSEPGQNLCWARIFTMLHPCCSSRRVEDNEPYLRWGLWSRQGVSVPGRHSRNQGGRECCPQRAANVSGHSYTSPLRTGTSCLRTAKSSRNGEILMYMYLARRAADAKWKRRARDRRALPLLGSGHNARVCLGNSLPGWEREKKNENFACVAYPLFHSMG